MANPGTVTVRILGDASHFKRTVGDVDSGVGRISASFKKMAFAASSAFAAVGVATFAKDAIKAASDLGESISKVNVVFGEAARGVQQFASSAAAIGQSRQQALAAAGTFGNLLRSVGLGERTAADFSVAMTKLASDLASFNNTSVDEALTALRAGLVGETEPLKRFGVNLNEATLKAKALELGLVRARGSVTKIAAAQLTADRAQRKYTDAVKKHGPESAEALDAAKALEIATGKVGDASEGTVPQLNAAQKAQAAYALIMGQTKLAQGDFARTSDGLANKSRILAAQFENLKAKVGSALLPVVTAVTGFLADKMVPAVETVGRKLVDLRDAAADKLGPAFKRAAEIALPALTTLRDTAGEIASRIGEAVRNLAPDLGPMLQRMRDQVAERAEIIVDGLREAIEEGDWARIGRAAADGIRAALVQSGKLAQTIHKALSQILKKVDWVGLGIEIGKFAVPLALGFATGLINFDMFALLKGVVDHWLEILLAAIGVGLLPAKITGKIVETLARIPLAGKLIAWGFEAFAKFGRSLVDGIFKVLGAFGKAFVDALGLQSPKILSRLKNLLDTLVTAIGVWGIRFGEAIVKAFAALGRWIAEHGPKQVVGAAEAIGKAIMRAIIKGFKALFPELADAIKGIPQAIKDAFVETFKGLGEAVGGGIKKGAGKLVDVGKGLIDKLPGRAHGGSVTPGRPYIVGEKGPELFVPRRSGTVVPNQALRGQTRSSGVTIENLTIVSPQPHDAGRQFLWDLGRVN